MRSVRYLMIWWRVWRASRRKGMQLHFNELMAVGSAIRRGSNVLVFGLGNDSSLWRGLNKGGRTVFLENNGDWFHKVTSESPHLEAYLVDYTTRRRSWRELMDDPARLEMVLPEACRSTRWDLVLVDGPTGWGEDTPGRMQSIYAAAHLVRPGGDVFVHDAEREVEAVYARRWLGTDNLVQQVRGRALLEHYRIS